MSKEQGNAAIEKKLAEEYGTGRHGKGLENMSEAVSRFEAIVPPPREQRAPRVADTREALLALHRDLRGAGAAPATGGWTRRRLVPLMAGTAAALAVLVALLVYSLYIAGPGVTTVATLRVNAGTVTVTAEDGPSRRVEDTAELKEGDTVRSGGEALAEILFDNGSVTRIDRDTGVRLDEASDSLSRVEIEEGQCYSQAAADTSLAIGSAGADSRTIGGALNFAVGDGGAEVVAIRDGSAVFFGADGALGISQGWLATVQEEDGVYSAEARDVTIEELSTPWYRFNLAMDLREGFDPGILKDLPEENVVEVMEQMVPPGEIHPEDLPPEEAQEDQDTGTEPEPAPPQPEPEPEPAPPQPEPEEPSSVSVQASSVTASEVTLSWSITGGSSYDGFSVLRTQGELAPVYPDNLLASLSGTSSTSYQDTAVSQGTYHYRVALMQGGSVKAYSNAVTATVPAPPPPASLSLSGNRDPVQTNKVTLSWTSTSLGSLDRWVVTRSEDGGSDVSWNVAYAGSSGTFTDTSASGTMTYYYRVAAISGGAVVKNSNTVTIPNI